MTAYCDGARAQRRRIVALANARPDEVVWAACPHVKQFADAEPTERFPTCLRCPATEDVEGYGAGKRACRRIAEHAARAVCSALAEMIEKQESKTDEKNNNLTGHPGDARWVSGHSQKRGSQ